jgi:hypothetical protein
MRMAGRMGVLSVMQGSQHIRMLWNGPAAGTAAVWARSREHHKPPSHRPIAPRPAAAAMTLLHGGDFVLAATLHHRRRDQLKHESLDGRAPPLLMVPPLSRRRRGLRSRTDLQYPHQHRTPQYSQPHPIAISHRCSEATAVPSLDLA